MRRVQLIKLAELSRNKEEEANKNRTKRIKAEVRRQYIRNRKRGTKEETMKRWERMMELFSQDFISALLWSKMHNIAAV